MAEHSHIRGQINLNLSLEKLLFLDKRKDKSGLLNEYLNPAFYDIANRKKVEIWRAEEWYEYYEIELENLF